MPTYDYRCKDCATELEVVQKFTDDALTVCPECNGNLRKVYSAVGVVFKGSGFYRTDSRAQDKQRSSAAGAGSKASGAAGAESKKSGEKSDSSGSGSNGSAGSNASGSNGSGSSTKPEKASSGSGAGHSGS